MTFQQYARNNVMRNKRAYAAHFLSCAFSVMMFFTYALISFHPDLQGDLTGWSVTMNSLGKMAMKLPPYFIFIFSFFFVLYSVSAFLQTRKKEFGILLIHGMTNKQLNKLVFLENMIIGVLSMALGILVGLVFAKLVLLISADMLAINKGLPFYLPYKAIGITLGAFFVLFLAISFFTSRTMKVNKLIELMQTGEKPKPEPKASIWLSILAVVLIGTGYLCVFYFAIGNHLFSILFSGVGLVVVGTYFFFTQCSVFIIRFLQKRERLFFKRTNILTMAELVYRMRDNANMFFMVAVVSAVAFVAIGTCAAMGNQGLAKIKNPYAFTYISYTKNPQEQEHVSLIERELTNAGFSYHHAFAEIIWTDNNLVMSVTNYNQLAQALEYPTETLKEGEFLLIPGRFAQERGINKQKFDQQLHLTNGTLNLDLSMKKAVDHMVMPQNFGDDYFVAVTDQTYERILASHLEASVDASKGSSESQKNGEHPSNSEQASSQDLQESSESETVQLPMRINAFVVEDWVNTLHVSNQLNERLQHYESPYHFYALSLEWKEAKQENGLLLISSVMIGFVFFTFASSFLYFRLYTDLDREHAQYQLIGKLGLTGKELRKTVTRQLLIMFFLPIVIAIVHSGVAFTALQQLLPYSVMASSVIVLGCFVVTQFLYFWLIRWRYLKLLYRGIV
ncbi:ABC transporter permease [Brevibacillus laterosporus]|uniref:ABC transporter permease n=1 Tax=Brevibacillus laterosporus TaxID=1465 RepID=A0A518VE99_BRELA|nr:ABC transporter permease [Brevibacillus laterosporus]QDX95326.1 ABC transporter permease [Brevibacillus laterosporus]TPG69234.1 ABC transporter permease [Brevibacillus laterosporus]